MCSNDRTESTHLLCKWKYHSMGWASVWCGLDSTKQENMCLFVYTKTTEPKPVKLDIGSLVILPPMVSALDRRLAIISQLHCHGVKF